MSVAAAVCLVAATSHLLQGDGLTRKQARLDRLRPVEEAAANAIERWQPSPVVTEHAGSSVEREDAQVGPAKGPSSATARFSTASEVLARARALYEQGKHADADRTLEALLSSSASASTDRFNAIQILSIHQRQVAYLQWMEGQLAQSIATERGVARRSDVAAESLLMVLDAASTSNGNAALQLWELSQGQHGDNPELLLAGARLMLDRPPYHALALSTAREAVGVISRTQGPIDSWPVTPRLEAMAAQYAAVLLTCGDEAGAQTYVDWLVAASSPYVDVVLAIRSPNK